MAARRSEFYFQVVKTNILRMSTVSEQNVVFRPRENKIHILKPPCNFLFII